MADAHVLFYREPKHEIVRLVQWLDGLLGQVQAKRGERIDRLAELGHQIRRLEAAFLRDGIYERRPSHQGVHYRMLKVFVGKAVVVGSHESEETRTVPAHETGRAIQRRRLVETDSEPFTFRPE